MKKKSLKPGNRTAMKDARKAVVILQRAEELIKDTRDGTKLEYKNYTQEALMLSAQKVSIVAGAVSIASIAASIQSDVLWTEVELLLMMGIPITTAVGLYNLPSFSPILSPYRTRKARAKQKIENELHRLYNLEREQREANILLAVEPLLKEVNTLIKETHTTITFEPKWGKFAVKKTVDDTALPTTETKMQPEPKPLPKWESIYILTRQGAGRDSDSYSPYTAFNPEWMKKDSPTVEEAIAILRHTETVLEEEMKKTKDPNDAGRRNPQNPEYIKKEARLLPKVQPALDAINSAIPSKEGKVLYSAGTRYPNFNISNGTGVSFISRWQLLENLITENLVQSNVTALDSLKSLELPHETKSLEE